MSIDQADWTNSVTVFTQGGTPVSTFGGPVATAYTSTVNQVTTGSSTVRFGPTDINQHYLISAVVMCSFASLVSTGTTTAQHTLTDWTGAGILAANFWTEGLPSAGQNPQHTVTLTWPGGLKMPIPNFSNPLFQSLGSYNAFSGSVTSADLYCIAQVTYV